MVPTWASHSTFGRSSSLPQRIIKPIIYLLRFLDTAKTDGIFFKTSPLFPPWIVSLLSSAIANYREVFQCSHLSLWIDYCFILSVFGYTSLQTIIIASLYALSVLTSTVPYHSLFFRTTGIIIYFKLQSWVEIPMVFLTMNLLKYPCNLGSGSDWLRVQVGSYITNLHTWW